MADCKCITAMRKICRKYILIKLINLNPPEKTLMKMGIMSSISLNLSIHNCRTREPFDSRTKQVECVGNVIWENTLRPRALEMSAHVIGLNKFKIKQRSTFRKKLMRVCSSLARPREGFALGCVSEGRGWYTHSVHVLVYLCINIYVGAHRHKYLHVCRCNVLSRMRNQDEKSQKNLSFCLLSNVEIASWVYLDERLLDSR